MGRDRTGWNGDRGETLSRADFGEFSSAGSGPELVEGSRAVPLPAIRGETPPGFAVLRRGQSDLERQTDRRCGRDARASKAARTQ